MLRPLLIIGVVFVHIDGISDKPSEIVPTLFNWFAAFFKNGIFRGTVPTMSLIAGFLLFSAELDRSPTRLYKKKFMTLVIPFVIFNIFCFAFMATTNATLGATSPTVAILQQSMPEVLLTTFGIYEYPLNGPLHFVRDMIVTVMLVPILSYLIRHAPWLGLFTLAAFFGADMDGALIFRWTSLILFYIGGVAAVYKWNLLSLDKYSKPCLLILVIMCIVIIGFRIDDNTILVMTAPFLIWSAVTMLDNTKIQGWALDFSKYSFFIFVTHMPLLGLLWWATTHHARWIPYAIYWFAAPLLTVSLLKIIYDAASRYIPAVFNFAIGSRSAKPAFRERRMTSRPADAPVYSPEFRLTLTNS
jgi:succinoglycan biosynthesis protein ExoH